jgi:hypothetical protein
MAMVRAYRTPAALPRGALPCRSELRLEREGDGTRLPDPGDTTPWRSAVKVRVPIGGVRRGFEKKFFFFRSIDSSYCLKMRFGGKYLKPILE